jgi:hypothetical protein
MLVDQKWSVDRFLGCAGSVFKCLSRCSLFLYTPDFVIVCYIGEMGDLIGVYKKMHSMRMFWQKCYE